MADGARSLKFVLRFTKGMNILSFCRFLCSFFEDFWFYVGRKKVYKSTLVYPFGILMGWKRRLSSKSWFQTPKEGYDNRFDEFLTFFWKGVGYTILFFLGVWSFFLSKNTFFWQTNHEIGRHKTPRAHIFSWGTNFSSRFRSERQTKCPDLIFDEKRLFQQSIFW